MNLIIRFRAFALIFAVLSLASLACNVGRGSPTAAPTPIPVSTEAAGELERMFENALTQSAGGQVSLVMTEEQLTSFVALKLAEDPNNSLSDVQIILRDGRIRFQAQADVSGLKLPVEIVLTASAGADGNVALAVDEAGLGPMPIPASILEAVSQGLNEVLTGELGPQATGMRVTQVEITDGQMAITGTITR